MWRTGSFPGVWATLLCLAVLAGCNRHVAEKAPPKKAPAAEPEQTVQVVEAKLQPWPSVVRAQGTLIEDEYALLGAKVAGRVKEVLVDIGTSVSEGQTVAVLDDEEFDLKVQQAEAQVAQARATLGLKQGVPDDKLDPLRAAPVLQERAMLEEARFNVQRVKGLIGKGIVTQEEIQARESAQRVAEARFAAALNSVQEQIALLKLRRSELALAVQNRQDAELKAPFVGIIQETHVAPGSYVNVGQPVAALVRTDPLRFRAGVPERSAMGVAVGQPIRILLEGQVQPVEARISRISPALDVSSRALMIEADIDNTAGRLRTGLFAEAEILVDADQQVLAVPASSVVSFGGVEKVWAVKDNQAEPRQIRVGRRQGEIVEVIEGLEAGEMIVYEGDQGREGVVRAVRQPSEDLPSGDRAALSGG
ncbi:MAG: efflux RND transporter periplasmic adaptor subunit [Planctomycetota bacterium]|nr:MAG: efflux RND transporter periplasmic adaptor subunit [Planctomycetota bacterium]